MEMGALVEGTIALVAPAALLRGVTLSAVLAREKSTPRWTGDRLRRRS